jgi:hypothetical protein
LFGVASFHHDRGSQLLVLVLSNEQAFYTFFCIFLNQKKEAMYLCCFPPLQSTACP